MTDVSVIIPFTQRDVFLARAVASVETARAAAPSLSVELLPVDDSARTGVSCARNRGLVQASGDWIVFLDADDALGENFFRDILLPLKDNPTVDLVACGFETVSADAELTASAATVNTPRDDGTAEAAGAFVARGGLRRRRYLGGVLCRLSTATPEPERERPLQAASPSSAAGPRNYTLYTGCTYLEHRILNRDTHVWAKAFRRSALAEDREFGPLTFDESLTIGEDMLFLVDLALRAGRRRCIAVTETVGYRYTINPNGAMKRPFTPSFLDELNSWARAEQRLMPCAQNLSPYVFSALGTIRIRSALLVATKIARLPSGDRENRTVRDAFAEAEKTAREMKKRAGAFAGLSMRDRLRALLLLMWPSRFIRLAGQKRGGVG